MATLIAVYNSEGCVGRCDAKCYGAHEPGCNCVCQGKNHGAGLQQATRNTEELAEQWIQEYKSRNGTEALTFERPGVQMELAFESVSCSLGRLVNQRAGRVGKGHVES